MSSCLSSGGGGRSYGFELELAKPPSPACARSSHSSSPSSTLSESSNSPIAISTKRSRTPRKRPNQTYNEAAALLSTIYPTIFSTKTHRKQCKQPLLYDSFVESSELLLPPFPAISDASFLIREASPEKPGFRIEPKLVNCLEKECLSLPGIGFRPPCSPGPLEDDFDTESILDEETGEGIDSIMGDPATAAIDNNIENSHVNPILGSLMGFGLGGKFHHGFGFNENVRRALKKGDDWEWWRSPRVAVRDIVPKFKSLSASSPPPALGKSKKKKKKVENEEGSNLQAATTAATTTTTATATIAAAATTTTTPSLDKLKTGLGLKLNHEDVLKEWSDRGSPFGDPGSPESSAADVLARLGEIELFPEEEAAGGAGVREASVMRYKEKRRTRLFSKKIRYQVRKVNADQRPRMKASGRFVKRPSLLREAIAEESQ